MTTFADTRLPYFTITMFWLLGQMTTDRGPRVSLRRTRADVTLRLEIGIYNYRLQSCISRLSHLAAVPSPALVLCCADGRPLQGGSGVSHHDPSLLCRAR